MWHPLALMAPSCGGVGWEAQTGQGTRTRRNPGQDSRAESATRNPVCAQARRKPQRTGYNPHSVGRQWCGEEESVRIMLLLLAAKIH